MRPTAGLCGTPVAWGARSLSGASAADLPFGGDWLARKGNDLAQRSVPPGAPVARSPDGAIAGVPHYNTGVVETLLAGEPVHDRVVVVCLRGAAADVAFGRRRLTHRGDNLRDWNLASGAPKLRGQNGAIARVADDGSRVVAAFSPAQPFAPGGR